MEAIQEFYSQHFVPSNMVIAGSGVEAKTLEHLAGPLIPTGGAAAPAAPASK